MKDFDSIGVGFVSNDHLAGLTLPLDSKVKILTHRILGGGPAGNSTAGPPGMPALRRGGRGDQVPRVERMMPTRGLKGASRVTLSESSEFLKGLSA